MMKTHILESLLLVDHRRLTWGICQEETCVNVALDKIASEACRCKQLLRPEKFVPGTCIFKFISDGVSHKT